MKLAVDLNPTGATMLGATIPPGDTAAADAKKPAEGTPKTVEQKTSPLKVLTKELRTLTPAESKTQEVEFSEYSYQTMVETIADNLDIVNRLVTASSPVAMTDLHKTFYETMKLAYKFKKEDFDKPEKLKEYAEKFLQEHKGLAVRLAKELAEWEAATLQAATDREFVNKEGGIWPLRGHGPWSAEHSTNVRDEFTEVSFIQTQDGSVVSTQPTPSRLRERLPIVNRFYKGKKIITQIDRIIKGGRNMDVASGLLNAEQKAYLDKCGWTTRTLTPQELLTIDAKLAAKAAFRQEMYVKTGQKDLSKIEVNYITKSSGTTAYIDNRTKYFINETTAASTAIIDILQTEGKEVAKEVKDKVEEEFAERDKKNAEATAEAQTVKKLKDKIAEIKKSTAMSEPKKAAKIAEIDAEIKRLTDQSQDFNRTKTIRGEIEETERKKTEAEKKLDEWANKLGGGVTLAKLKNWSNPTHPDHLGKKQKEIEREKAKLTGAREEIKTKLEERKEIMKEWPNLFQDVPLYDNDGKPVGTIPKADPADADVKQAKADLDAIRTRLSTLNGIIGDESSGAIKRIKDLEEEFSDVESVVEKNTDIKALCEAYHGADREITIKKGIGITGEIDEVSERIAKLIGTVNGSAATKNEVKDVINGVVSPRSTKVKDAMDAKEVEIEKSLLEKEEAKKNPDALSAEQQAQIDSMEALIKLYEPSGKEAYEKTFATIESGETVKTNYDPEWDTVFPHDTTMAIKRLIHLYYGDGVMMKFSDQEAFYKQVMTLFKTKAIIDIVIDDLEASPLATTTNPVAVKPAVPGPDGLYTNAQISAMFPAGTRISTIDANNINFNRDLAIKILNHIRETIYNVQKI